MSIRIAIFDDNKNIRNSIILLLNTDPAFEVVGTFSDAQHCVENVLTSRPDVVLMDIEMPGINGIEAVRMINEKFPSLPVMIQTVFDHDQKIFQSILAGATGYMLKKTAPSRLLEAIREIYEGGAPMTPEIALKVLQFFKQHETVKKESNYALSSKEKEILAALVDGLSYKMIADKLDISYHTVNFHIRNIYQKLHVHSVSEAVAKALKERIV